MNLETTCRIPRDELLGLLNTMTPIEQQRITAEFAAVAPPSDLVITFRQPKSKLTRARIAVIGASFCVSFGLGIVAAAML
jgi:hypothetical protein